MNPLESLQPLVNALGWMLIHFLWQGMLLVGAYALLRALIPERNSVARYWLGMTTYGFAVALPVLTFWWHYEPSLTAMASSASLQSNPRT